MKPVAFIPMMMKPVAFIPMMMKPVGIHVAINM